jgi:hypothetical protein
MVDDSERTPASEKMVASEKTVGIKRTGCRLEPEPSFIKAYEVCVFGRLCTTLGIWLTLLYFIDGSVCGV